MGRNWIERVQKSQHRALTLVCSSLSVADGRKSYALKHCALSSSTNSLFLLQFHMLLLHEHKHCHHLPHPLAVDPHVVCLPLTEFVSCTLPLRRCNHLNSENKSNTIKYYVPTIYARHIPKQNYTQACIYTCMCVHARIYSHQSFAVSPARRSRTSLPSTAAHNQQHHHPNAMYIRVCVTTTNNNTPSPFALFTVLLRFAAVANITIHICCRRRRLVFWHIQKMDFLRQLRHSAHPLASSAVVDTLQCQRFFLFYLPTNAHNNNKNNSNSNWDWSWS